MINIIKKLIYNVNSSKAQNIEKGVDHSLNKYKETYKLLEEYDTRTNSKPEDLADPGRLRAIIQKFQKETRVQRTNPAV